VADCNYKFGSPKFTPKSIRLCIPLGLPKADS